MATVPQAFGTLTATGVEQTVTTISNAGNYVFTVDLSLMQAGDVTILKIYRKVLTGGALRLAYQQTFYGVQDTPVQISVPFPSSYSCSFTLQQSAGTLRQYDYIIEAL